MRQFRRLHRRVRRLAVDSRAAESPAEEDRLVVVTPEEDAHLEVEAIRVRRVEETLEEDGRRGVETHVRLEGGILEGEIIIVLHRGQIRGIVLRRDRIRLVHNRDGLRLGDRHSGDVRRNSVLRITSGETTGDTCTTTTGGILAISTWRRDRGL
jgi:hypothetical protein